MMISYNRLDQYGFTIVEIIITIVLLGILAIIALPKFFNIAQDSKIAEVKAIAGALSSANAENYAVRVEKGTNGIAISNCTTVAKLLQAGLPTGYKIKSKKVNPNITINCTLIGISSTTATFNATGIK